MGGAGGAAVMTVEAIRGVNVVATVGEDNRGTGGAALGTVTLIPFAFGGGGIAVKPATVVLTGTPAGASSWKSISTPPKRNICPGCNAASVTGARLMNVPLVEPRSFTITVLPSRTI